MKLGRFQTILDAYGAVPDRWPEREREAALALARSSLPAARSLNQARALDSTLHELIAPDLGLEPGRFASLHAGIVAAARPRTDSRFQRWLGFDLTPSRRWPSLAGFALATVLGFAVGLGGFIQLDSDRDSDDVSLLSPTDLPAIGP